MRRSDLLSVLLIGVLGYTISSLPWASSSELAAVEPLSSPVAGKEATEDVAPRPHHYAEVQIKTLIKKTKSFCTLTIRPQPQKPIRALSWGLSCGHDPHVSKLTCQYLGSDDEADRYQIERAFPAEGPQRTTEKKDVSFHGKQLVLFEDEFQLITMGLRPPKQDEAPPKSR